MPYLIEYSPDAYDHLRGLTARERAVVLDEVERQLSHEPTVETRNRKQMRPNPLARWALRIGGLRVYYEVVDAPELTVRIRAVGIKQGNKVLVDGQEVTS